MKSLSVCVSVIAGYVKCHFIVDSLFLSKFITDETNYCQTNK